MRDANLDILMQLPKAVFISFKARRTSQGFTPAINDEINRNYISSLQMYLCHQRHHMWLHSMIWYDLWSLANLALPAACAWNSWVDAFSSLVHQICACTTDGDSMGRPDLFYHRQKAFTHFSWISSSSQPCLNLHDTFNESAFFVDVRRGCYSTLWHSTLSSVGKQSMRGLLTHLASNRKRTNVWSGQTCGPPQSVVWFQCELPQVEDSFFILHHSTVGHPL